MQRRIHRVGIVVAVVLVAHLWMLQAGAGHASRVGGDHLPSAAVASAELPPAGGCTSGMTACVAPAPDDRASLALAAALALTMAVLTPRRRRPLLRFHRVRRDDRHPPRPCVPPSVVLLQ